MVFILCLGTLSACRTGVSNPDNSRALDVVDPDGSDNPGSITLKLPDLPDDLNEGVYRLESAFTSKGRFIVSELKNKRESSLPMPTGSYCLKVETTSSLVTEKCGITVPPGGNAEVVIGGVHFVEPVQRTLGLDRSDVLGVQSDAQKDLGSIRISASSVFLLVPGKYHVTFGIADGMDFEVEPGVVSSVDLGSLAQRTAIIIKSPTDRVYPTPNCGGIAKINEMKAWSDRHGKVRPVGDVGEELLVGHYGNASAAKTPYTYTFGDPDDLLEVPLVLSSQVGGDPTVFRMVRIDVNDVKLAKGDGSMERVPGDVTIERLVTNPDNTEQWKRIQRCMMRTQNGMDVVPGKYRVKTDYQTLEAGNKTDTKEITLR